MVEEWCSSEFRNEQKVCNDLDDILKDICPSVESTPVPQSKAITIQQHQTQNDLETSKSKKDTIDTNGNAPLQKIENNEKKKTFPASQRMIDFQRVSRN